MIPGAVNSEVLETMDPAFGTHCHRIDSSNFNEYRAPHTNKVKYTPPSPTTSGYSESGSEMDNPDSGRVSEMEGSPKMQPRRPGTISLNIDMFAPNDSRMTSPDPFPEGKSTIKMGRGASSDSPSLPDSPKYLAISEQTLRTLVVCLHENKTRLDRMETKMDALIKVFRLHYHQSSASSRKLARAVIALGNDYRALSSASRLENGRRYPKFQDAVPVTDEQVPVCRNKDVPISSAKSRKFQSSQCLRSGPISSPDFPCKASSANEHDPSTYPRIVRSGGNAPPPSVAPSSGEIRPESYDNVFHPEITPERAAAAVVNDDVIVTTKAGNDAANAGDKSKISPVYAVVKRTKKSVETLDSDTDEPPALPRRSCDLMASPGGGPSQAEVDQIMQMVQELEEGSIASPKDDAFSNGESLTRVSRFSEVESLLSAFDTSTGFSDDKPSFDDRDEEFERNLVIEEYDNKDVEVFEEDVFSPEPYRNQHSGVVTHEFPHEKREAPSTTSSWLSAQHGIVHSSAPSVERTLHVSPKDDVRQSEQILPESSPGLGTVATKSVASMKSENSKENSDKKSNKKSVSEKNLSSDGRKKPNVIVANYSKFFKRKGKKKRSESQNSFTFVTSPLHEAQLTDAKRLGESPPSIRRGQSVDSVLSGERDLVTSFLNIFPSQDETVFLDTNKGEEVAPAGVDENKPLDSKQSSAEEAEILVLKEATGSVGDFDSVERENIGEDDLDGPDNEEMRPNIVKIAKKAFRNSPKILRRNKIIVQTAELKPKLPNGHVRASESSLPSTPKLPLKESWTTPETTPKSAALSKDDGIEEDVFVPPGVILERLQREQADRIRFDVGHSPALDNPPPKPNRPGFTHGGVQGSPRSSINAHPNGNVPGYPRGMPAVPPKQKIMSPEELTNHEAQEKLRIKQMEEAMLQQTLNQQQKQAAENALWLEQEEQMLNPDVNGEDSALRRGRGSGNSIADMRGTIEAPPPPSVAPSKPPRKSSRPKDEPAGPPQTKLEEVKTAPTMQLNRDDDEVYKNTMEVVKAVLGMNNMTMNAKPDELFASVKTVGAALKLLCASLEGVLPDLPEDFHREIDMAQRTTNKDLSQVINQLKLVQRFYTTTQVVDYKKCLMAANQVLAIDAKNLLDVVDRARIRKIQTAQEKAKAQEDDIRLGAASQSTATGYEPEDLYPDGEFL